MQNTKTTYKNTEIGPIPEDWGVKLLKDITTDMLQGVNTAIDIPEYVEFGYPMLKANNIIDGEVNFSTSDHISAKTYQSYSDRFKIQKNDFLFSNIGARLGTGSLMKTSIECSFAWNVMRIIPNKKIVNPEFLGCIMNSTALYKEIKKNESGSGMGFVPKNVLQALKIPLPPSLTEQKAIATALSDTDALISSLEQLITKKRAIKQGAMQELLKPKDGWEVKKLGEIAEVVGGGTPSTSVPEYWKGGINWFTPTEIGEKKYTYESNRKISNSGFLSCSAKMLPIGTILLTSRAGIGDVSILKINACTNQGFQSLIPKLGYSNEYLYYLMITLKSELVKNASGSTFLEISPNKIKEIEIKISTLNEQTRIATILSDMDTEIENLEHKLHKYKQIKQGMMQQLLTGKIRLV